MNKHAEEAKKNEKNKEKFVKKEKRQTKMISFAVAAALMKRDAEAKKSASKAKAKAKASSSKADGVAKKRGRPKKEKKLLPDGTGEGGKPPTIPRIRWTEELHVSFVHAVHRLGGVKGASPKMILELMNVTKECSVTVAQVKSHLQMYRKYQKREEAGQVKRRYFKTVEFPPPSPTSNSKNNKTAHNAGDEKETAGIQAQGNNPEQPKIDEKKGPTYFYFKEVLDGPSTQVNNNDPPEMESLGVAAGNNKSNNQILQNGAVAADHEKIADDDEEMLSLTIGSRFLAVNNQNPMPDLNEAAEVSLELTMWPIGHDQK